MRWLSGDRLLLTPEGCDLLLLLLRELTRHLAAAELLALHEAADLVDDLRVRQRGDVPDVGEVGDAGDHATHDLARAGLRHVRDHPDVLGARDLADLALDRLRHRLLDLRARLYARLEG